MSLKSKYIFDKKQKRLFVICRDGYYLATAYGNGWTKDLTRAKLFSQRPWAKVTALIVDGYVDFDVEIIELGLHEGTRFRAVDKFPTEKHRQKTYGKLSPTQIVELIETKNSKT